MTREERLRAIKGIPPRCQGIDLGAGDDRTVITLTVLDKKKSKAKIDDAIAWLTKEYPGAEIRVREVTQC